MPGNDEKKEKEKFHIFIDEKKYDLDSLTVKGEFLRSLPPVPEDYDLWLRARGSEDDTRIEAGKTYTLHQADHFYTSKSEVGPGAI